jgi:hypothetical protein
MVTDEAISYLRELGANPTDEFPLRTSFPAGSSNHACLPSAELYGVSSLV